MVEKKTSKRNKNGGSESAKSGRKLKKKKSNDDADNAADVSQKSKKVSKSKRALKGKKAPPPPPAAKLDVSTKGKKKPKVEKTKGGPAPSMMVRTVMVTQMNGVETDNQEASKDVTVMPSVMPTVMQPTTMQQPTVMKPVMPTGAKGQGDAMTPAGEKSAEIFFNHVCEMSDELLNSEWERVNAAQQPPLASISLVQKFGTDVTIPCYSTTRVKVENLPNDFYHCNRLTLDKNDRKWIIAQAPKDQMQEAFWRMVFQEGTAMILMLGSNFDLGKKQWDEFFPQKKDEYKYFGAMYVNNKKVEMDKVLSIYSLEVLPEGCSNSIVVKLVWALSWNKNDLSHESTCLSLLAHVHKLEAGATLVSVSASGTGRACVAAAISVLGARICNGGNPDVVDVVTKIKQQRANSIPDKAHYMFIYMALGHFVKLKIKDKKKWDQPLAQLKQINTT